LTKIIKTMVEIILKNKITKHRMEALTKLLKSWNIDAEMKETKVIKRKSETNFSLSKGIWKDFNIDANQLRNKAWKLNP
jgi:hypothetical protein